MRVSIVLITGLLLAPTAYSQDLVLPRNFEPVILTDATTDDDVDLSPLYGAAPTDIAGYAYLGTDRHGTDQWRSIPVQVDERDWYQLGEAYGDSLIARCNDRGNDSRCRCATDNRCSNVVGDSSLAAMLYWTDPGTHVGGDSNPAFDADDEVVFMARDAGPQAPTGAPRPAGVNGNGVEVNLSDPITGAMTYAYLFRLTDTSQDPAPDDYVTYNPCFVDPVAFDSLSAQGSIPIDGLACQDYLEYPGPFGSGYNTYGNGFNCENPLKRRPYYDEKTYGANPENTTFVGGPADAPNYELHFSSRWIMDEMYLNGADVDILDRQKILFFPPVDTDAPSDSLKCLRTEAWGSCDEGAFIVNRSGPVRTIRAVMGMNSGPLTQRHYLLYDRFAEIETSPRVHRIYGVMDLFDYSQAFIGENATYTNNLTPQIEPIDATGGVDLFQEHAWEFVQSDVGSLIHLLDIPTLTAAEREDVRGYFEDASPSSPGTRSYQCTGDPDSLAVGLSGIWIDPGSLGRPQNCSNVAQCLENTDPRPAADNHPRPTERLTQRRRIIIGGADLTGAQAATLIGYAEQPLTATASEWGPALEGGGAARASSSYVTALLAPHPNPASDRATVPFTLAQDGPTRLVLLDMLGREVQVLHDGTTEAGTHEVTLNTQALASGVYILQFTTPVDSQTQRITLVRER